MDDQPQHERPHLFDLWPPISFINCPECKCHWSRPGFSTQGSSFPALDTGSEHADRKGISRAYCPSCGILLPEIDQLILSQMARRTPVHGKPFVGTVSGVRAFLNDGHGCQARLWDYVATHSCVVLKIDSKVEQTHAFVVCIRVRQMLIPAIHWDCRLSLDSTEDPDCWALVDAGSGVRIECVAVGIFHSLESLC